MSAERRNLGEKERATLDLYYVSDRQIRKKSKCRFLVLHFHSTPTRAPPGLSHGVARNRLVLFTLRLRRRVRSRLGWGTRAFAVARVFGSGGKGGDLFTFYLHFARVELMGPSPSPTTGAKPGAGTDSKDARFGDDTKELKSLQRRLFEVRIPRRTGRAGPSPGRVTVEQIPGKGKGACGSNGRINLHYFSFFPTLFPF